MNLRFDLMNQKSVEIMEDLRRTIDQKPCPDAYSEVSGELKGESTAEGVERVTPIENQPEK